MLAATTTACAKRAPAPGGEVLVHGEETGTIRRVGTFGFGIVPDRDPGTRYAPDRLPLEFQADGLRVAFSGKETPPPEGVRLWGTPFHLASIRRADR